MGTHTGDQMAHRSIPASASASLYEREKGKWGGREGYSWRTTSPFAQRGRYNERESIKYLPTHANGEREHLRRMLRRMRERGACQPSSPPSSGRNTQKKCACGSTQSFRAITLARPHHSVPKKEYRWNTKRRPFPISRRSLSPPSGDYFQWSFPPLLGGKRVISRPSSSHYYLRAARPQRDIASPLSRE